jgi:hypothetical protein
MDIQAIMTIGITMDITIFLLSSMALIVLVWIHREKHASKTGRVHKTKPVHTRVTHSSYPIPRPPRKDIFPNGYSRQDYHNWGANDSAIDYFGLDQPSAPEPGIAGIVLMKFFKGKG